MTSWRSARCHPHHPLIHLEPSNGSETSNSPSGARWIVTPFPKRPAAYFSHVLRRCSVSRKGPGAVVWPVSVLRGLGRSFPNTSRSRLGECGAP